MTYISQAQQRNEYYLGYGSDASTGTLYIKEAKGGHTLISYSKINGDYHIMLVEFRAEFHPDKFKRGQEPRQVSMLDIVHIMRSLRIKIMDL